MSSLRVNGSWSKISKFLEKTSSSSNIDQILNDYGAKGVAALSSLTPQKSGVTAASWDYEIEKNNDKVSIVWTNSNINNGVNIAVIIQYGHGTRNGGYVEGIDYINPALQPIFDQIVNDVWKEVIGK